MESLAEELAPDEGVQYGLKVLAVGGNASPGLVHGKAVNPVGEVGLVGGRTVVACAPGGGRQPQGHGLQAAGFVAWHFEALDLHGPGCRAEAHHCCCGASALGQELSDAPTVAHIFQYLQEGIAVAEPQFHAAGVLGGQESLLKALHGPGHGGACADGVQPQVVTDGGGANDYIRVGNAAKGTQGKEAFVLHAHSTLALIVSLVPGHQDSLAADGAVGAAGIALQVVAVQLLAADLFRSLEGGLAEVAGGQGAQSVEYGHVGHGAQVAVLFGGGAQAAAAQVFPVTADRFGFGDFHRQVAANSQGQQVLGAHYGAQPAAARLPSPVIADGGELDLGLSRRTDAGHAVTSVTQTNLDCFLLGGGPKTHQVGGVFKPHGNLIRFQGITFDPQQGRLGRSSNDDKGITTALLQFGCQVAGGQGIGDEARQGRLGEDGKLAGGGQAGAHQWTAHEKQRVFGSQWISPGGTVPVEQVGAQPNTADEVAQGVVANRIPAVGACRQVNNQGFVVITVHRSITNRDCPGRFFLCHSDSR